AFIHSKGHTLVDIAVPYVAGSVDRFIFRTGTKFYDVKGHAVVPPVLIIFKHHIIIAVERYRIGSGGIAMIVPVVDHPGAPAVQAEPVAVVAADGNGIGTA